ncbi:MAG: VOC family protein [Myxococcota bacterium]
MPTPTLDAFGMVVSDMSASLAFYRALGLEFPDGAEREPHVETTLAGGIRLMLDTVEVVRSFSEWEPPSGGHRMGLAFRCAGPDEVDAVYATLTGAGHRGVKAPWDAFWGQRYAQLADPDGNPVDLYAPLG